MDAGGDDSRHSRCVHRGEDEDRRVPQRHHHVTLPTPTAVLDDGDLSPRSVYQIHMPLSATSESSASRSHRHKAALNPAALT